MDIGILGTGIVGRTLGSGFAAREHHVRMGSRDPSSQAVTEWVRLAGPSASAGTFTEAAAFGAVIVLATLWSGTRNAIALARPGSFAGKIIIDATNPLRFAAGSLPELEIGFSDSGGEQIQRWLPEARVVKAFNTVGAAHMVDPRFPGGPPDLLICGDDDDAKRTVSGLAQELGWPTLDLGGIDAARLLEPLAMTWIRYGITTGTWNHAFRLLRK
jgi:8-hydroxy-5-deazaflavin:NADPH oxidoreductase